MAISNKTVLMTMSNEIQEAMLNQSDEQKVREHVRSIRLLADLLLEHERSEAGIPAASSKENGSYQEPTAEEIRKMMGTDKAEEKSSKPDQLDEDDANGSSIFDF
ncbi:YwdI family protein [Halobacillus salinarum]|uniref:YwdI family protein n=1 Tax=Halobacillus salinarum TaxID=2932257 RepID=A0ABY4ENT9_9BACI|nr:YwdI family protein [Halobacillus salinarum]UOQ45287.1 YwdI family protein [Halobacillus salinarum]